MAARQRSGTRYYDWEVISYVQEALGDITPRGSRGDISDAVSLSFNGTLYDDLEVIYYAQRLSATSRRAARAGGISDTA